MRIQHHKPAARGVNQLMYIGDDGTSMEGATGTLSLKLAIGAVVVWLLMKSR
jgi:hypothetical protein